MFSCWDIYRFAILSRVRIARQTKKAVMDFSDAAGGGGGVRGGRAESFGCFNDCGWHFQPNRCPILDIIFPIR